MGIAHPRSRWSFGILLIDQLIALSRRAIMAAGQDLPVKHPQLVHQDLLVDSDDADTRYNTSEPVELRRVAPYWHPYNTMAKGRWFNREILELVSTEFRDRSIEYYRFALESGVTTVNGKIAKPGTIIRNGDRIQNMVHRHEPPITSTPIEILLASPDYIVINKPGSIPVHATGRFYKHSLVHILRKQLGLDKIHTINRLDRLTSGLMIIPLSTELARTLGTEFFEGKVQKEYIARCSGKFPEGEVLCDQPLLTVDRQMGLNIVHPEGKHAQTKFNRIFYDAKTDTSVLHCRPLTGRSHQIRVHLQYLGHPIANDPIYTGKKVWVRPVGEKVGRGGLDVTPSDERAPPVFPDALRCHSGTHNTPIGGPHTTSIVAASTSNPDVDAVDNLVTPPSLKLLPRESGLDVGMGSPVPLSAEAVGVITRLRNMKDEDEDWSRWRDVVFRAKGAKLTLNTVEGEENPALERGMGEEHRRESDSENNDAAERKAELIATGFLPSPSREEPNPDPSTWTAKTESGTLYCTECYLPLHPDPEPERLYIFLHALRYTTSLGSFETKMPAWAQEGWTWRGQ
ncbi:pseudouridine synthase [Gautieria morchelliformis]|nr:pseudouridine synthase [Gautieria morchelliformis]